MIETGQQWRHKKRGTVYEIVDNNCRIQVSSIEGPAAASLEEMTWIAYRDVRGAAFPLCFRMKEEFLDGRFELVGP
jgi:hypothetical protein